MTSVCGNLTSEEENVDNILQSSSDSEVDVTEETVTEVADKEPEIGDFFLVKLKTVSFKNDVHYVGKVTALVEDKSCEISFYRQSRKMPGRFIKPIMEDVSIVQESDIVLCLPQPSNTGGTKRVSSMLKFDVNLDRYNCQ